MERAAQHAFGERSGHDPVAKRAAATMTASLQAARDPFRLSDDVVPLGQVMHLRGETSECSLKGGVGIGGPPGASAQVVVSGVERGGDSAALDAERLGDRGVVEIRVVSGGRPRAAAVPGVRRWLRRGERLGVSCCRSTTATPGPARAARRATRSGLVHDQPPEPRLERALAAKGLRCGAPFRTLPGLRRFRARRRRRSRQPRAGNRRGDGGRSPRSAPGRRLSSHPFDVRAGLFL